MTHHSTLLSGLLCCGLAFAIVTPASARTRIRSAQGPRGSATQKVEREPGSAHRDTTATNNAGGTATHAADRTWDRTTQTGTVATRTTLPDGRTAGREGTFQKNADGSASAQGTYQRFSGGSGTYEASTQRTDTGRTSQATITNAAGKTSTIESATVRTDDGHTRTTTATGPNGSSTTKEVDVSRSDDGTTRTVTRSSTVGE